MGAKWGCLDGFWIKPDGTRLNKDEDQSHADIVLMHLSEVKQEDADNYLNRPRGESSYDMVITEYGLKAGWIRVLEEADRELSAEYYRELIPRTAWSSLHRYISGYSMADQYLFEEPGRNCAAVFYRKADALRFLGTHMR